LKWGGWAGKLEESLENWIGIHVAKHAGEGDVKTSCEIIETRNNTLLRQVNGAKMSVEFFNIGERKMGTEKKNMYMYMIDSFIPLACAEPDDSLPFSGASSIPFCYIPFPSTLFHQLVFCHSSPHLAILFLVFSQSCFQVHM